MVFRTSSMMERQACGCHRSGLPVTYKFVREGRREHPGRLALAPDSQFARCRVRRREASPFRETRVHRTHAQTVLARPHRAHSESARDACRDALVSLVNLLLQSGLRPSGRNDMGKGWGSAAPIEIVRIGLRVSLTLRRVSGGRGGGHGESPARCASRCPGRWQT